MSLIRIAILEHEKETKDIVYELAKLFSHTDWVFRHYWKASVLARACQEEEYHIYIFDEMFKNPRLESVFVHDNPNSIFIYVCKDAAAIQNGDQRARIFYIQKDRIVQDLEHIAPSLLAQSSQSELYDLNYGGIHVRLPYEEIYYLEKIDKMVYFHTKKGVFHQRINMADLEALLERFGFVRVHVSYLVNSKHIMAWYKDEVELITSARLPLSRSAKRKINSARKKENS